MMTNHNLARPAAKTVKPATRRSADKVEVVTARARLGPEVLEGQSLKLPENLPYQDWVDYGKVLVRVEHAIMWWLGDWWRFGIRRYGRSEAEAAPTGYALTTLKNAAWVATRSAKCPGAGTLSRSRTTRPSRLWRTRRQTSCSIRRWRRTGAAALWRRRSSAAATPSDWVWQP